MASQSNPFDKSTTMTEDARTAVLRDRVDNLTQRRQVPPSTLSIFHRNPRKGDVAAIAASLKAHDQYKPIVVNVGTHTGRPHEVLAGNHTLMAIRNLAEKHPDDERWESVLVHWVDVDDDRCNRIVAADNQTAQLGGFDFEELAALLEDIGTPNLGDIGFTDADLGDIHAMIQESAPALPDPDTGEVTDRPGPRQRPDGLIESTPVNDRRGMYEDTATRMMILTLPIPQFIWAQEKLAELRSEHSVENNTEMVLGLISAAVAEEPPSADAAVTPEAVEAAESVALEAATAE